MHLGYLLGCQGLDFADCLSVLSSGLGHGCMKPKKAKLGDKASHLEQTRDLWSCILGWGVVLVSLLALLSPSNCRVPGLGNWLVLLPGLGVGLEVVKSMPRSLGMPPIAKGSQEPITHGGGRVWRRLVGDLLVVAPALELLVGTGGNQIMEVPLGSLPGKLEEDEPATKEPREGGWDANEELPPIQGLETKLVAKEKSTKCSQCW